MRRLLLLVAAGLPAVAGAQQDEPRLLREARMALGEGLPQVAVLKVRAHLSDEREMDGAASLLLAQALLARGDPAAAMETLQPLEGKGMPEVSLLLGRAAAAQEEWSKALTAFQAVGPEAGAELRRAAAIGEAGALKSLGQLPEAIDALRRARRAGDVEVDLLLARLLQQNGKLGESREVLARIEPGPASERKWAAYLEACAQLAEGDVAQALEVFRNMLATREGLSESLLAGATMGLARAQALLGSKDEAVDLLEDFIKDHASSEWLEPVFALLDELYASRKEPVSTTLKKWTQKKPWERTALALYYLARAEIRDNDPERAIKLLDRLVDNYPQHPRVAQAVSDAARLQIERADYEGALALLERGMKAAQDPLELGTLEMLAGTAHFRRNEFEAAARNFRSAGQRSPQLREQAIFNAALAWLRLRNYEAFLAEYREISVQYPESELRRELILEEGLLQLGAGDPAAGGTLRRFVSDFPDNRRVPEAQLALAEQAYLAADREGASRYLRVANEGAEEETADRAACLEVFMKADDPDGAPEEVIEAALEFLRTRPGSPLTPEVRMKLAEVYFREGDYGNARTQFEILAKDRPESSYAPAAQFLAGQAAARSMNPDRALELFDEVARGEGPFQLYARQEQAALKSGLGQDGEAVILYDRVLRGDPDPELRYAAMAGKGMSLSALGKGDPQQLEQAVAVFDELAGLPNVTLFWRNQALYRKGKVLQSQGKEAEALTAFYDALAQSTTEGAETFWFYKAGFEAAQLLESREDWKGAIGIYEKMARLEAPRAAEIRSRIDRLRLEHFIWEE